MRFSIIIIETMIFSCSTSPKYTIIAINRLLIQTYTDALTQLTDLTYLLGHKN